jgi:putative PIN family toxin of toxin-antitoxin system
MGKELGPGELPISGLRVVLDTSSLVSAVLFRGTLSGILELMRAGSVRLVASPSIMDEYERVFHYPKFGLDGATVQAVLAQHVLPYCEVVQVTAETEWCRDPSDDKFLNCAVTSEVDVLVASDKDLLALGPEFQGVPVLTPAQLLQRFVSDQ